MLLYKFNIINLQISRKNCTVLKSFCCFFFAFLLTCSFGVTASKSSIHRYTLS